MDALAPSTEQFLSIVSWVSQLEEMDIELRRAGRSFWARLARAQDAGDADTYETTINKLGKVGMLLVEIAQQMQLTRAEGQLQVLGLKNGQKADATYCFGPDDVEA